MSRATVNNQNDKSIGYFVVLCSATTTALHGHSSYYGDHLILQGGGLVLHVTIIFELGYRAT